MSHFPEDELERPLEDTDGAAPKAVEPAAPELLAQDAPVEAVQPAPVAVANAEPPMFQAIAQPEPPVPPRIPHLGHFLLLLALVGLGFIGAIIVLLVAIRFHLGGVTTLDGIRTNIFYQLGSEGLGYVFSLAGCMLVFPLLWHKGFFAGVQWNGATAARLFTRLVTAALICFALAIVNSLVLPQPKHAPIEDIMREPGAAWLMFAFGVTFAPFFEEMFFRGFLLPALCTAYDWCAEKIYHKPRMPLGENGHPQWSFPAMAIAAVVTSIPFAGMHAAQIGNSIGPLLLLMGVSIVLCGVRLWTRSLASSTLVHSSYNFMLFLIMLITTHGFRHLDKL
jgi:membrane protease YdiL (CAAX protease family)